MKKLGCLGTLVLWIMFFPVIITWYCIKGIK